MKEDEIRIRRSNDSPAPMPAGAERKIDPTAGSGWAGAVPNLGARTIVGVFDSHSAMEAAYRDVLAMGLREEEVSIVRQRGDGAAPVSADDTKAGAGAATGAVAGAVLGGLAGLAAVAIPGLGPILVAGPIAAAVTGAVTGGAVGGLVGSFAGLGIPNEDAERFEAAVRAGGTFLSVKTAGGDEADRAVEILKSHGAREVTGYNPTL